MQNFPKFLQNSTFFVGNPWISTLFEGVATLNFGKPQILQLYWNRSHFQQAELLMGIDS